VKKNLLLIVALAVTAAIAVAGILDPKGLAESAARLVAVQFDSRAWFIMLTVSFMLITALGLAISPLGGVRLGKDDERPEFSTVSWLTMLFAAGMGVGILYWGTAEPLTHYLAVSRYVAEERAGYMALFLTNFHWGLHAWAIYAMTGLVVAYFAFRRDGRILVSEPIVSALGSNTSTRAIGWICDLLAIIATAIGLGGSMAMGVFHVEEGVVVLFGLEQSGGLLTYSIFGVLVLAFLVPLTVDLSKGMALLSNVAMGIAAGLMIFILIAGPTAFIMGTTLQAFGDYVNGFLAQGSAHSP